MNLAAIPTEFNGVMYRSRTEARWAVFFKALDLDVRYEPEGYDLHGLRYAPDFLVPAWDLFVEVKPSLPLSSEENEKAARLAEASGKLVLVVLGSPDAKRGVLFENGAERSGDVRLNTFFAHCRRCPRVVLTSLECDSNGNPCYMTERPIDGACPTITACGDRFTYAGSGFDEAINAARNFTWQPTRA